MQRCLPVRTPSPLTLNPMPEYIPSMPFEDFYGSAADKTCFHMNGKCYIRRKPSPVFRNTEKQSQNAALHRRALDAWRGLEHETQKEWNRLAAPVISHRPPFDGKGKISGYNLFVSAYHGFAQLGDEHVPVPQPFVKFPPYSLEERPIARVEGDDLSLRLRLYIAGCDIPSRYRLLTRIQLTEPGRGRDRGKMRNYLALAPCAGLYSWTLFRIPDYRNVWKLDLQRYGFQCRYVLLDTVTGYRGFWQDYSSSFALE